MASRSLERYRLPFFGNADFKITLTDAPGSASAVLVLSGIRVALPGTANCVLHVGAPFRRYLSTVTDGAGDASVPLPIPCSPSLAGFRIAGQWGILTPGFNALGLILSDDLSITWN